MRPVAPRRRIAMKGPPRPADLAADGARPPALRRRRPAEELLRGGWYDSCRCPGALPTLVASMESGCLLEFEICDTGFDPRGHGLGMLLGRGLRTGGEPYYLVEAITADTPELEAWVRGALQAPNGVAICVGPAPDVDLSGEVCYIMPVEMVRVVSQEEALRGWGGAKLLEFLRGRDARRRAPAAAPPAETVARPRVDAVPLRDAAEPEMRRVRELEAELLGGGSSRRRDDRPREMPSLAVLPAGDI